MAVQMGLSSTTTASTTRTSSNDVCAIWWKASSGTFKNASRRSLSSHSSASYSSRSTWTVPRSSGECLWESIRRQKARQLHTQSNVERQRQIFLFIKCGTFAFRSRFDSCRGSFSAGAAVIEMLRALNHVYGWWLSVRWCRDYTLFWRLPFSIL